MTFKLLAITGSLIITFVPVPGLLLIMTSEFFTALKFYSGVDIPYRITCGLCI